MATRWTIERKPSRTQTSAPSVALRTKALQNAITRATRKVGNGFVVDDEIDEVRSLLEALPLSSDEYSLANNRLHNADRYCLSAEWGAAAWELVALAKSMSTHG